MRGVFVRDRVLYPKMVYHETFGPLGYKIIKTKEEHDELLRQTETKGVVPIELDSRQVEEVVKRTRNRAKKSELRFSLGE